MHVRAGHESMHARARAHTEVADVPTIVILPLGLKPDGSPYDKSDMVVIAPELARFDLVLPRAKAAMDDLAVVADPEGPRSWEFDPATGTTSPTHR